MEQPEARVIRKIKIIGRMNPVLNFLVERVENMFSPPSLEFFGIWMNINF